MKIYLIVGQRHQRYEGEYGLEALACMTEADNEANPDYLTDEMKKNRDSKDFDALALVALDVPAAEIRRRLYPDREPIPAKIVEA